MTLLDDDNDDEIHKILEELVHSLDIKDGEIDISATNENIKAEIKGSDRTVNVIVDKSLQNSEKYMYTNILPEFVKMHRENHILDTFHCFANWYTTTPNGELIIDDLKRNGYKKTMWLDYEHVTTVIVELAKFHAMSLALHFQNRARFEEFHGGLQNDVLLRAIVAEEELKIVRNRLQNIRTSGKRLQEWHEYVYNFKATDMHSVVVHGKSSMKSLLFKYKKHSQVPIEVCFPDWKMARLGSPAFDLSYFLFTSTDREFRRNHYDYLLQVYYGSLCTYLHLLGISNPNKLMTYSDLCNHMKKYSVYVLYMIYYAMGNDKSKDKEFNDETITDIIRDFIQFDYL